MTLQTLDILVRDLVQPFCAKQRDEVHLQDCFLGGDSAGLLSVRTSMAVDKP
jgi:hypothetical protein